MPKSRGSIVLRQHRQHLAERFERNVHIVPFSTCHYWGGAVNDSGYGMLTVDGRQERAHRIAYSLRHGDIPNIGGKPAVIRHKCDTPLCVNPDHLEPGTQLDNIRDAVERRRMPRGTSHHYCTVNDEKVGQILADIEVSGATVEIAKRHGVSPSYVSTLRHGRGRAVGVKKPTGRSDRRISDQTARDIYDMAHSSARPRREIAEIFNVPATMVSDIKRGATYASVTGHRR